MVKGMEAVTVACSVSALVMALLALITGVFAIARGWGKFVAFQIGCAAVITSLLPRMWPAVAEAIPVEWLHNGSLEAANTQAIAALVATVALNFIVMPRASSIRGVLVGERGADS